MLYSYLNVETWGFDVVEIDESRIRGLERQIGLLKYRVCKESKKSTMLFLLGLTVGLLANILIDLLSF